MKTTNDQFILNVVSSNPEKISIEFIPSQENIERRKTLTEDQIYDENVSILNMFNNSFQLNAELVNQREYMMMGVKEEKNREIQNFLGFLVARIDDSLEPLGYPRYTPKMDGVIPNTENIS